MTLQSKLFTAIAAVGLSAAAPAFAAFNYNVNYSDASGSATYPATTTITTTNPLTFFTVAPGGSVTGSNLPTNVGLFTLTPVSTAPSGSFAVTETHFTTTVSIQTVTNLDGTGPIGVPVSFVVTGDITGTLGPDADNTLISNVLGLPHDLLAGGVNYQVSLDSIRSPGVIGAAAGNTGGVTLHIIAVPEPASLSLLGLTSAAALLRRRRPLA